MQPVTTAPNYTTTTELTDTPRTWRFWDVLGILVLTIVIVAVLATILTVIAMSLNLVSPENPESLLQSSLFTSGILFAQGIGMVLAVWLGMLWRKIRPIDLGLGATAWRLLAIAAGVAVGLRVLAVPVGLVLQQLGFNENPQLPMLAPEGFTVSSFLLTLIAGGIVVPIAEELFFRGVIYRWLRQWGLPVALVVSSLIFAIAHFNIPIGIIAFLLGIACAMIYERTQSLWTAIAVHIVFNSLGIMILYAVLAAGVEIPGVS